MVTKYVQMELISIFEWQNQKRKINEFNCALYEFEENERNDKMFYSRNQFRLFRLHDIIR